jgi:Protein containing von Willebrand factor type A (vWA) domain
MLNLVLDFVTCLRASDLRVSTAEVLDCINHLPLIDPFDETVFKTALRANFVKSKREQRRFDRLYNLFFHDLGCGGEEDHTGAEDILSEIKDQLAGDEKQAAVADFLSGDPLAFLELLQSIREMPAEARFNLAPLGRRLELMVALNTVRDLALQRLAVRGEHALEGQINARVRQAFSLLVEEPRPDNELVRRTEAHEQYYKNLGERPFGLLSQQEVLEVREVIDRLVRKLKDIVGRRSAVMSRGTLDVKKTLRQAQRYQGVPMEIRYRHHPKSKARIVTLCDVSSSVWSAARFMLNVLYSLQECFAEVKSFIFVAGLAEVTKIFKDNEVNQAIDKVLKEADLKYNVSTDYGATLRQFRKEYLHTLDKKTTLIIIGDGRTNYMHPEDGILAELRDRSRRLIWLNPEPQPLWYTGDSEMRAYEPYCHELRSCRNLNQLMEFVEELVL